MSNSLIFTNWNFVGPKTLNQYSKINDTKIESNTVCFDELTLNKDMKKLNEFYQK